MKYGKSHSAFMVNQDGGNFKKKFYKGDSSNTAHKIKK
jgi:hypothetical protein